jgi:hypothetical protein
VVLGCAVVAVLVAWRLRAVRLPGSAVAWWLASVCVFGIGVAIFDTLIYGGPLRSGYRPGEITFSLSAIGPNLRYMPAHLIQAMPMLVLGLGALAGLAVVWLRGRRAGGQQAALAGRDLAVGVALAAPWAAIWALYATYTWTAATSLSTLQAARFYVPALGAIALIGAWLLVRLPRRLPLTAITTLAVAGVLFGLGGWAFHDMYQFPFGQQLVVVHGPGPFPRRDHPPGLPAGSEAGFITGEQLHRAAGIACIACASSCGARSATGAATTARAAAAAAGAGAEGAASTAAALSSASRCRDGSRTIARITPRPKIPADTAKATV